MRRSSLIFAFAVCLSMAPGFARAQMISTQTPLQHNGTSFYESSHLGWSVHNPHYFMNFNGGSATPPFGGYQPNAGLHGGFAVGNAQFDFGFGQGASINSTSVTPVLTTTDGFPGSLFIGSQRPFVTGVVPVVGGGFASVPPMGPLAAKVATGQLRLDRGRIAGPALDATGIPPSPQRQPEAGVRGLARVVEVPVVRAAESKPTSRDISATEYLERATVAQKDRRLGVAKIYYQLAATKGDAIIKAEATRKLETLKTTR